MFSDDFEDFRSVVQIEDAANDYSRGFYNCLNEPASSVDYTLALGVSNFYPGSWTVNRVESHGVAWGNMVKNVRSYQTSHGYSGVILAAGAADIEPGWSGPTRGRHWVDSFDGVANSGLLWNFGSADGCPWFGLGGTGCSNGWDQADLYYISWDVTAGVPAPQDYRNDAIMAEQWVLISKWGNDHGGSPMIFRGPLSEDKACAQVGCSSLLDNTPTQAWNQMIDAMDARPATIVDMAYSLDIRWR